MFHWKKIIGFPPHPQPMWMCSLAVFCWLYLMWRMAHSEKNSILALPKNKFIFFANLVFFCAILFHIAFLLSLCFPIWSHSSSFSYLFFVSFLLAFPRASCYVLCVNKRCAMATVAICRLSFILCTLQITKCIK